MISNDLKALANLDGFISYLESLPDSVVGFMPLELQSVQVNKPRTEVQVLTLQTNCSDIAITIERQDRFQLATNLTLTLKLPKAGQTLCMASRPSFKIPIGFHLACQPSIFTCYSSVDGRIYNSRVAIASQCTYAFEFETDGDENVIRTGHFSRMAADCA